MMTLRWGRRFALVVLLLIGTVAPLAERGVAGALADSAGAELSAGQLAYRAAEPDAALAARARLFVGVDSAPMHIAAAVGTPAVALFGPSDEVEWSPWGTAHRVVASPEFPCRPCRNDGCGGGKVSECLTTLPVDRVMAAVDALLAETASADVPH